MQAAERVAENLNRGLHTLFENDPRVYLLGEDVLDPYGGAFKVTRGLSTRYPDRVITTPISEGAIVGVGNGLALAGDRAIVEVMFGDFVTLAFDQIVNFAAKSVAMYGRRLPMHLVVRCPVGGNRGYGPTHSQCPQKHFVGVPDLALFEVSPFHDNVALLERLVGRGEPCLLFEDKGLYGERMLADGRVDELFRFDYLDTGQTVARAFVDDTAADCVIVAPGGVARRALAAARELLVELELGCQVIVPSQLYPLDLEPLLPVLERAGLVCVAEESTAGGTWGAEVARRVYDRLWGRLRRPVLLVSSRDSVIPTAPHLERDVLLQSGTITRAVGEALDA